MVILLFFLGHWAKILWGCARKILACFSKLDSHFQRKLSEEIFSLCKNYNLLLFFWKSSGKNSSDYRKTKTFRGVLRLLFISPGNFSKKIFLKFFCVNCQHFFWWFPVIEQEKFGGPVKTAFFVSMEKFFEKKTVLENNWSFSSFSTLSRRFRPLFWRVSYNCILRVHRST